MWPTAGPHPLGGAADVRVGRGAPLTEVSFHFNVPERVGYACRLLRKATRHGAQVVVTADGATLADLDQALWAFDPIEFIPHLLLRPGVAVPERMRSTPVWLAEQTADAIAATDAHGVLVNLGLDAPEGFESFERLIEIVSNDEADRGAARLRWKHYANRGYAIVRHEVGE